jgi:tetratricopeptide (TPR) repeat protein
MLALSSSDPAKQDETAPPRQILSRLWARRRLVVVLALVGLLAGVGVWSRTPLRALYHRRAARLELERYHTPQAIRHLHVCREIWPRDPDVLLLAARAARRAGVYADSDRLLRTYREVRGRDDAYSFEHLLLTAESQVDQVDKRCWSLVEQGHAETPLLLEALTRGYLRQYQLGRVRTCLDRWRQLQPENAQVFFLEALFLFDYLHAPTNAVDSYRHALVLDADHEEARLGLAVALLSDKHFVEATEHFARLRQAQPDNLRVLVGLAECYDGLGETTEAVILVDDVLARQPGFASALSLRGQLALKSGQRVEAETWLRQALRSNPRDHRARYSLALCLEQTGQEEEAQRQRRQLEQMEQDLARFHDIVTKELPQRPSDPALHRTLGQLLLRSGQREEGLRWLQSALRLDPQNAAARQAIADLLSPAQGEKSVHSP